MPRRAKVADIFEIQQPLVVNAAIYTRVSTEDQANEGFGLDVQRVRAKAQIEAKGWEFAGEYSDPGLSGTLDADDRPGLAKLLEDARDGKINAVVVLALDRLARKTVLVLSIVEMLDDYSVALVSCKESLDTTTPTGRFVLTMFAALAQLERDTIVERTTAGRNERGKVDGEKGGRVPLGYKRIPGDGITVDPNGARVVKNIFALRRIGYTMDAIADALNRMDVTTPRGHRWHGSSVKVVLDNEPIYRGAKRGDSDVRWDAILT